MRLLPVPAQSTTSSTSDTDTPIQGSKVQPSEGTQPPSDGMVDNAKDPELEDLLGTLLGDDDDAEELDDFVKYEQASGGTTRFLSIKAQPSPYIWNTC